MCAQRCALLCVCVCVCISLICILLFNHNKRRPSWKIQRHNNMVYPALCRFALLYLTRSLPLTLSLSLFLILSIIYGSAYFQRKRQKLLELLSFIEFIWNLFLSQRVRSICGSLLARLMISCFSVKPSMTWSLCRMRCSSICEPADNIIPILNKESIQIDKKPIIQYIVDPISSLSLFIHIYVEQHTHTHIKTSLIAHTKSIEYRWSLTHINAWYDVTEMFASHHPFDRSLIGVCFELLFHSVVPNSI